MTILLARLYANTLAIGLAACAPLSSSPCSAALSPFSRVVSAMSGLSELPSSVIRKTSPSTGLSYLLSPRPSSGTTN